VFYGPYLLFSLQCQLTNPSESAEDRHSKWKSLDHVTKKEFETETCYRLRFNDFYSDDSVWNILSANELKIQADVFAEELFRNKYKLANEMIYYFFILTELPRYTFSFSFNLMLFSVPCMSYPLFHLRNRVFFP